MAEKASTDYGCGTVIDRFKTRCIGLEGEALLVCSMKCTYRKWIYGKWCRVHDVGGEWQCSGEIGGWNQEIRLVRRHDVMTIL